MRFFPQIELFPSTTIKFQNLKSHTVFGLLWLHLFTSSLAVVGINFVILCAHFVFITAICTRLKSWSLLALHLFNTLVKYFQLNLHKIYSEFEIIYKKNTILMGQEGWCKKPVFFKSENISKIHLIIAKRQIFIVMLKFCFKSVSISSHFLVQLLCACIQLLRLCSLVKYSNLFGYNYELYIHHNPFLVCISYIGFSI